MSDEPLFYVKVRYAGEKQFGFVSPAGYITRRRVHAARFTRARAEEIVSAAELEHAGVKLRIVQVAA